MFQLEERENASLRSQVVTLESGRGKHRKYLPFVFTEQGVAMLSSVLRSETAIQVNVEIMRVFVRMKLPSDRNSEIARKLESLEMRCDERFKAVFDAIKQLVAPVSRSAKRRIGFKW
jgi:hypothetical protein